MLGGTITLRYVLIFIQKISGSYIFYDLDWFDYILGGLEHGKVLDNKKHSLEPTY